MRTKAIAILSAILGAFAIYLVQACTKGDTVRTAHAATGAQTFTKIAEFDFTNDPRNPVQWKQIDVSQYPYVIVYSGGDNTTFCNTNLNAGFYADSAPPVTSPLSNVGDIGRGRRVQVDGPTMVLSLAGFSGPCPSGATIHVVVAGVSQ